MKKQNYNYAIVTNLDDFGNQTFELIRLSDNKSILIDSDFNFLIVHCWLNNITPSEVNIL